MGLFAPLGPFIAARFGPRRTLAVCVAGIVGFGLLRAAVPGPLAVVATTVGLGLAMGTAGAFMSIVVKERAPRGRPWRPVSTPPGSWPARWSRRRPPCRSRSRSAAGGPPSASSRSPRSARSSAGSSCCRPTPRSGPPAGRRRPAALAERAGLAPRARLRAPVAPLLRDDLVAAGRLHRAGLDRGLGGLADRGHAPRRARDRARRPVGRRPGRDATRPDGDRGHGRAPRLPRRGPRPRRRVAVGGPHRVRARGDLPAVPDPAGGRGPEPGPGRGGGRAHAPRRLPDLGARPGPPRFVRDATGNFGASLWLLVALAGVLVGVCLALTPDRLRHGVEPGPARPERVAPDTIAG